MAWLGYLAKTLTPQDRSCHGRVIDRTGTLTRVECLDHLTDLQGGGPVDGTWKDTSKENLHLEDPAVGGAEGAIRLHFSDVSCIDVSFGAPKLKNLCDSNPCHGLNYVRVAPSFVCKKKVTCRYNRHEPRLNFEIEIIDPAKCKLVVLSTCFSDYGVKALAKIVEEEIKKKPDLDCYNPNCCDWGKKWEDKFKEALELAERSDGCMLQLQGAGVHWKKLIESSDLTQLGASFDDEQTPNQKVEEHHASNAGCRTIFVSNSYTKWERIVDEVVRQV